MGDQGTGNLHQALMPECEIAGTDERVAVETDDLEKLDHLRVLARNLVRNAG